jgi:hypothetical protein
MSATTIGRSATLDRFVDAVDTTEGVDLRTLPPMTTVLVTTRNSLYRIVTSSGTEVVVQGGAYFPEPKTAHVEGASVGGSCLKVGWIGVGLVMEIRDAGRRIVTSPVRAIMAQNTSTRIH